MHKVYHDDCPEDFKQLFDKSCGRYARSNSLVVPRVATEQGRMSARLCGPNPGGGGVLSIFVLRGCAVFQGIVFAYFF